MIQSLETKLVNLAKDNAILVKSTLLGTLISGYFSFVSSYLNECHSLAMQDKNTFYNLTFDLAQNISLLPYLGTMFDNCDFGNVNVMPSARYCFDHCAVQRNCNAVEISGEGTHCRFCVPSRHGGIGLENVDQGHTYVNVTTMLGECFVSICTIRELSVEQFFGF